MIVAYRIEWPHLNFLSVAEFSGELNIFYENGHKKILGNWLDLVILSGGFKKYTLWDEIPYTVKLHTSSWVAVLLPWLLLYASRAKSLSWTLAFSDIWTSAWIFRSAIDLLRFSCMNVFTLWKSGGLCLVWHVVVALPESNFRTIRPVLNKAYQPCVTCNKLVQGPLKVWTEHFT